MAVELSKRLIDKLEAREKPYELRDGRVRGLILRVQPSGRISWVVERRRGQRRTLARPYPITTLDAARQQALALLSGQQPWDRKIASDIDSLRSYLEIKYAPWVVSERRSGRMTVNRIRAAFSELLDRPLIGLTPWTIDEWKRGRLTQGVSPATVNRDLNAIRAALGKAVEWGVLDRNPMAGVSQVRVVEEGRVRWLSEEEVHRLRAALERRDRERLEARSRTVEGNRAQHRHLQMPELNQYSDYLAPFVLLALNTGCRRSELTGLRWENVDLERRILTISGSTSKSAKTRHVPLNREASEVLRRWRSQRSSDPVFPVVSPKRAWAALLDSAQIANFRLHDCRHHFASRLVMLGVDLNTVRELLGHADLKMTLRYAHLAPEHRAAAVERLGETWKG